MDPALLHSEYFLVFINYPISALYSFKNCALPQSGSAAAGLTSVSNDDIPRSSKVFHIFFIGFQSYPRDTDSR